MFLTSKLTSKRQVLMKKLIYPGSNQIIYLNYEEIGKSEKTLYIFKICILILLKPQNKPRIFTCSKLHLEFDKSEKNGLSSVYLLEGLKSKAVCLKKKWINRSFPKLPR